MAKRGLNRPKSPLEMGLSPLLEEGGRRDTLGHRLIGLVQLSRMRILRGWNHSKRPLVYVCSVSGPWCVAVSVPLSSVLAGEREILTVLLLDELAQALGQLLDVDLDLGLDLSDPLVDLELDGLAGILVGGHGKQDLHVPDGLVSAAAARARVLGLVGSSTVQAEILAQPVVHQAGDVLVQRLVAGVLAVDRLTVLEGEEDSLLDLLELSIRELDLASRLLTENLDHRVVDRFALSHVVVSFHCMSLIAHSKRFYYLFR